MTRYYLGLAAVLLAGGAQAADLSGQPADMPAGDLAVLSALLDEAGVASAKLRSTERTPENQARVMLQLVQKDAAAAKAMYCGPGDRVLDRYSSTASEAQNLAEMTRTLKAQLPAARAIGCLSHIQNDDVYSVDLPASQVPADKQAVLEKLAAGAVGEGKLARFLAPPREPNGFHFEFKRPGQRGGPSKAAVSSRAGGAGKPGKPAAAAAPAAQAPAPVTPTDDASKKKSATSPAPAQEPKADKSKSADGPSPAPASPKADKSKSATSPAPASPKRDKSKSADGPSPAPASPKGDKSKSADGPAPATAPKVPKGKTVAPATTASKKSPAKK